MNGKLRSILPEKMVSMIEQLDNLICREYGVNSNLAKVECGRNCLIVNFT